MFRTKARITEVKLEDLNNESAKPEFTERDEQQLLKDFKFSNPDEEEELPVEMFYSPYDVDWYKDKFPGFPDEYYQILVDEHKKKEIELFQELVDNKLTIEEESLSETKNKHY